MKIILVIVVSAILSSCSSLIMNQGIKNYKSEIVKTNRYKEVNKNQQDLLYLNDLCVNAFPDIENVFPENRRKVIVDSLMTLLTDETIDPNVFRGYLYFYLSHYENQHTRLERSGLISHLFCPYVLIPKQDEWFLYNINRDYDSLLIGKKVIRFNNEPMNTIEKKLFQYVFAENDNSKRVRAADFTNRPDLLKQFGIIKQSDSILLTFETGKEMWVKSVSQWKDVNLYLSSKNIPPNAVTKYINHHYDISLYPKENYAYFQYNRCYDKIDSYETMSTYVKPLWVPFAKVYLNWQIKRKNTKKLQGYVDVDRPVFKDYLQLMFDSIQKQGIGNLIIDLRRNGGGSFMLNLQLLYSLTEKEDLKDFSKMYYVSDYNKQIHSKQYKEFTKNFEKRNNTQPVKGKLYTNGFNSCDSLLFDRIKDRTSPYYVPKSRPVFKGNIIVLANSTTGSAAALLTTMLQDNNMATVIGTSVSNNPIGASVMNFFRLPNSKYIGSVASDYFIRPNPAQGKIQVPDYWIENSVEDIIQGRDMCLERAFEIIKDKNSNLSYPLHVSGN